jgi:DNA repair protein SbcC/Rad50
MQLRSLTVRNIRSYAEGRVEFAPGVTLLVGDVGSGKTSLLHAIEMALFGFAEVAPEHLVRHREREAEVALCLSDGTHVYEFRRRFRRRRSKGKESFDTEESSYAVDGHRTRYSATELRQRAIDLLGFPDNPSPKAHSDVWRWAVYIPQERMREVLLQRPDDRLDTVRKALGIETYRTAADNAADLATALAASAERAEARAEGLRHFEEIRERAAQELGELGPRIEELTRAEGECRARLAEADRAFEELERARLASESDRRRLSELSEAATRDERERRELGRRRERAVEVAHLAREEAERASAEAGRLAVTDGSIASLEGSLGQLRRDRESAEATAQQVAGLEASRSSQERALSEARQRSSRADEEVHRTDGALRQLELRLPATPPSSPGDHGAADLKASLETLHDSLLRASREVAESELAVTQLQQLIAGGECPRCHQAVRPSEFAVHEARARADAEQCRARLTELSAKREALTTELGARESFDRALEEWRRLDAERTAARAALARAAQEGQLARAQVEGLTAELDGIALQLQHLAPERERRAQIAEELARVELALAAALQQRERAGRLRESASAAADRARQAEEEATFLAGQMASLQARSDAGTEESAAIRLRLAGQPELEERLRQQRRALSVQREALEGALAQLARARQGEELARRQVEEAGERLRERAEWLASARSERARASWVRGEFRQGLIELERRRLARAQAEFSRLLSQNFSRLIEDPALLARCDAAFTPEVELEGESTPAEALSGGERTALALAYRLAMGAMVRASGRLKLDTLILDEPTDGFSPEQVLRLGELLESLGAPQLLLVSHERQLEASADHVVVVAKVDGTSRLDAEPSERPPSPPAPATPGSEGSPPPARADSGTPPEPTVPAPLP